MEAAGPPIGPMSGNIDMRRKIFLFYFMMSLSLPLMISAGGCGFLFPGVEEETERTEGIATSKHYLFQRISMGTSFERTTSDGGHYAIDTTTGSYLSEGSTLSDRYHYEIIHPISWLSLVDAEAEQEDEEEGITGETSGDGVE